MNQNGMNAPQDTLVGEPDTFVPDGHPAASDSPGDGLPDQKKSSYRKPSVHDSVLDMSNQLRG